HVKTHKTREIVRLELDAGITKQKVATVAEAELVASCGVPDVLLAYNLVGPNCGRLGPVMKAYPQCQVSGPCDHPKAARDLSAALAAAHLRLDVLLDVDVGQHRTGIAPGPEAAQLYEQFARLPGLAPGGLHVYDGHNHQESLADRQAAVDRQLGPVLE